MIALELIDRRLEQLGSAAPQAANLATADDLMDRSMLVRWVGFPATPVHGDTLVLDRCLWFRRHLPVTRNGERLLDVGCGTGAFTMGAARRGYKATGLSWTREIRPWPWNELGFAA